jgi:hypothetical protein
VTKRITPLAWGLLLFAVVAGCKRSPATEAPADGPNESPTASPEAVSEPSPDPHVELATLDSRTPVPLQPMMAWHQKQNMQEHLVAIQRIVDGLARGDWGEVAAASKLIESSPQMQRMCQHMGAGAEGFTPAALEFHDRADAIGEAARAQDVDATLAATSHTLQACTGCHAKYRQQVVDARTWQQRTGTRHDPVMRHPPAQ